MKVSHWRWGIVLCFAMCVSNSRHTSQMCITHTFEVVISDIWGLWRVQISTQYLDDNRNQLTLKRGGGYIWVPGLQVQKLQRLSEGKSPLSLQLADMNFRTQRKGPQLPHQPLIKAYNYKVNPKLIIVDRPENFWWGEEVGEVLVHKSISTWWSVKN